MADAALLAVSAGMAMFVSRGMLLSDRSSATTTTATRTVTAAMGSTSIRAALFLSFCLFSLSALEASPSRWLLFLYHNRNNEYYYSRNIQQEDDKKADLLDDDAEKDEANEEKGGAGAGAGAGGTGGDESDDDGNDMTANKNKNNNISINLFGDRTDGNHGVISIETSYLIILIGLSLLILFVYPYLVGSRVTRYYTSLSSSSRGNNNSININNSSNSNLNGLLTVLQSSMILRTVWYSISYLVQCIRYVLSVSIGRICTCLMSRFFCCSFWRNKQQHLPHHHHHTSSGPILVRTISEDNGGEEQQALVMVTTPDERATMKRRVIAGGIVTVIVYIFCLRSFAPWFVHTDINNKSLDGQKDTKMDGITSHLTVCVSWLCSVGLLISAILNGFGSVSLPYSCLAGLFLEPISHETIDHAEMELLKVQTSLEERKLQLNGDSSVAVSGGAASGSFAASATTVTGTTAAAVGTTVSINIKTLPKRTASSSAGGGKGSWKRSSFAQLGEEVNQRRQVLLNEISFLEELIEDMTEDISEMRYSQKMALQARTLTGKIKSWLGLVFSIILLAKLFLAVSSTLWRRDELHHVDAASQSQARPRIDIVTRILLWMFGHNIILVTQQDVDTYSQLVSLVITAFLTVSQVRTFVRYAAAANRRFRDMYCKCYCIKGNRGTSKDSQSFQQEEMQQCSRICSPMLAGLMGSYFLACVVLTKMMLPAKYGSAFAAALGGSRTFQIRLYAINATFVLSALLSGAILGMAVGIRRQNTFRNQSWSISVDPDRPTRVEV